MVTLRKTKIIDAILTSNSGETYDLILYDSGNIPNQKKRIRLIEKKIKTYAYYVDSGQMSVDYPESKEKEVRICVICCSDPSGVMKEIEKIQVKGEKGFSLPVVVQTENDYLRKGELTESGTKLKDNE